MLGDRPQTVERHAKEKKKEKIWFIKTNESFGYLYRNLGKTNKVNLYLDPHQILAIRCLFWSVDLFFFLFSLRSLNRRM